MGKRTLYLKTVWSPYLGEWRPFHDNWILKEDTACIFNGTAVYTVGPSPTPTNTPTETPTNTPTNTPTQTPTQTPTPSAGWDRIYFSGGTAPYSTYDGYYTWSPGDTPNGSKYVDIVVGTPSTGTTICADYLGSGFTYWLNTTTGWKIYQTGGNWVLDPQGYPAAPCGTVSTDFIGSDVQLQGINEGQTIWVNNLIGPMQMSGSNWQITYEYIP